MRWQRGSLKVAFLPKKANLAKRQKVAHSRQSLANVPMTWQRLPFESGDFGQNGKYCEHPPVSGKIQIRWQRGPLKVAILTKTAKCRQRLHTVMDVCVVLKTNVCHIHHFRQICHFRQNRLSQREPFAIEIFTDPLAIFFYQIRHAFAVHLRTFFS